MDSMKGYGMTNTPLPTAGGLPSLETLRLIVRSRHPDRWRTTPPRPPHSGPRPESGPDGSETGAGDSVSARPGFEGYRVDGRKVKQAGSLRRKTEKSRWRK